MLVNPFPIIFPRLLGTTKNDVSFSLSENSSVSTHCWAFDLLWMVRNLNFDYKLCAQATHSGFFWRTTQQLFGGASF